MRFSSRLRVSVSPCLRVCASAALPLCLPRNGEAALKLDGFAEVAVSEVVVMLQEAVVALAAEVNVNRLEALQLRVSARGVQRIEWDPAVFLRVCFDANVLGRVATGDIVGQVAFPDVGGDVLGPAEG